MKMTLESLVEKFKKGDLTMDKKQVIKQLKDQINERIFLLMENEGLLKEQISSFITVCDCGLLSVGVAPCYDKPCSGEPCPACGRERVVYEAPSLELTDEMFDLVVNIGQSSPTTDIKKVKKYLNRDKKK